MSPPPSSPLPEPLPIGTQHIPGALGLSRDAGWPHTSDDWAFFLSLSTGLAMISGRDVVATTLATPLGPVATLNMVLVAPSLRGNGFGRRIVQQAMTLADPDEWRLVATPEGAPLYGKLGFRTTGRIHQHQGIVSPHAGDAQDEMPDKPRPEKADLSDLDALVAADRMAGAHDRRALLAACVHQGDALKLCHGNTLSGFVIVRPFGLGEVAGPIVARDTEAAQILVSAVLRRSRGRFLRIDTPADCGLGDMLASQGLARVGGGMCMTLARRPLQPEGGFTTFALAAQAFG